MAIKEYSVDLDIKGRVLATDVPNSTGSIVTWNANTNVFGLRTNTQIISDLNLSSNYWTTNSAQTGLTGNKTTSGIITSSGGFVGALTGNASTATTLATARTINGTSFNGSANITTARWGTARNITIGDTTKSVNGSGNVSWSLAEIGAIPLSGTEVGSPVTGGIEFDGYVGDALYFPDPTSTTGAYSSIFNEDGDTELTGYDGTYHIQFNFSGGVTQYFGIYGDNPSFRGLEGSAYYGANYDDNTYVQKKYVDDNASTGLEAIDEGNGIGWRLKGTNPANYGNIGRGAIDLGFSDEPSTTVGATGDYSTVTGGIYNQATGLYSTVDGGFANIASGGASTVSGGENNEATVNFSTVGGGGYNEASGEVSTVSGGAVNTASGYASTLGGGYQNEVSGNYSTVSGGRDNTISGNSSTVGGGLQNTASNSHTTVAGGSQNTSSGYATTVGGGYQNEASNNYSTVGGGTQNIASGIGATIPGGVENKATSIHSTVGGGSYNTVSGGRATVNGGQFNEASGNYSTVGGGWQNLAKTFGEFLGGLWSTVKEGSANTWVATDRIFGIGNGKSESERSDAFNVYKNGVAELPSVTNALIDAAGPKTIPTKEWTNSNFDKYQSWNLKTNGVQRTTIQSGGNLDLVAGSNITLQYGAGGQVTINSRFNNTTYTAGTGLDLTGEEFSFDTAWGDGRYALASRTITAGNGLTGGGTLAANRTFTLGTPSAITLSSTNSVATSSHTHAFTPGGTTSQYIRGDGSLATFPSVGSGSVTSVGMTIAGAALNVSGSPITTSGTLALTWSGATTQYVRGDGSLATIPTNHVTTSRTITAGNGLSGGGTLAANRTITLGTPTAIGLSTINSVTSTSHTHALDAETTTAINNGNTAFGWGDFRDYGLGSAIYMNGVDVNTLPNESAFYFVNNATNLPTGHTQAKIITIGAPQTGVTPQIMLGHSTTGMWFRISKTLGWSKIWSTNDFDIAEYVPYIGATQDVKLDDKSLSTRRIVNDSIYGDSSTSSKLFVNMSSNRYLIFKLTQKIYSVNTRMNINILVRENQTSSIPGEINIGLRFGSDIQAMVSDKSFDEIVYYEDEDTGYIAVELRSTWGYADVLITNDSYFSEVLRSASLDLTDKTNVVNAGIHVIATEGWVTSQIPTKTSDLVNDGEGANPFISHVDIEGLARETWVTSNFDKYSKWILKTNGNSQWGVESDSFVDFRDSPDIQVIYEADGIVKFKLAGGSSGHQNLQGVTNVGNTTTNTIIVHEETGGVTGVRSEIGPKGFYSFDGYSIKSVHLDFSGLYLLDGTQYIDYEVDGIKKRHNSPTATKMMFPTDIELGEKTIPLSVNGAEADPVTGDIDTSNHAPIRPLEIVTFNMCYSGWKNETRFYVKTSTICINISPSDDGKEIVLTNDSGGTVSVAGSSSSFYLVNDGGLPRATVSSFPAQFSGRFRVMDGNFYQIL